MRAAALALLLLLAHGARAADDADRRRATERLHQGAALFERGDYQGALDKFEQAYAIVPSANILFNLGQTLQALARPVDAIAAYERFLVEATGAPPDARATAEKAMAELRSKVAALHVRCDLAGAEVSVDGRSYGVTPLARPILLAAGPHQVLVEKPGLPLFAQRVTASAGATLPLDVRLEGGAVVMPPTPAASPGPVTAPILSPPDTTPGPHAGLTATQKVGVGLMIAALPIAGTGVVLGIRARSDAKQIKEECKTMTPTCMIPDLRERDERNQRNILLQNILVTVGGAALLGGGLLWLFGGENEAAADRASLTFAPLAGGGMFGVVGALP